MKFESHLFESVTAKLFVQKQIHLYPNRLEIQSDALLIPVDEILSVNLVQTKSGIFQQYHFASFW